MRGLIRAFSLMAPSQGPPTLFVGRASPARLIDLGHSPGTVADEIPQVDLTGRISCTLR